MKPASCGLDRLFVDDENRTLRYQRQLSGVRRRSQAFRGAGGYRQQELEARAFAGALYTLSGPFASDALTTRFIST